MRGRWEVAPAGAAIQLMGDHAGQASGEQGAGATERMEDNDHEAQVEARKTSAVELGMEDEHGGVRHSG